MSRNGVKFCLLNYSPLRIKPEIRPRIVEAEPSAIGCPGEYDGAASGCLTGAVNERVGIRRIFPRKRQLSLAPFPDSLRACPGKRHSRRHDCLVPRSIPFGYAGNSQRPAGYGMVSGMLIGIIRFHAYNIVKYPESAYSYIRTI